MGIETADGVPHVGHFLIASACCKQIRGYSVHEISASHALAATTLALLVYTINLHIAINNRFLQVSSSFSFLPFCVS